MFFVALVAVGARAVSRSMPCEFRKVKLERQPLFIFIVVVLVVVVVSSSSGLLSVWRKRSSVHGMMAAMVSYPMSAVAVLLHSSPRGVALRSVENKPRLLFKFCRAASLKQRDGIYNNRNERSQHIHGPRPVNGGRPVDGGVTLALFLHVQKYT